jgi:predicted RNA-binding protein associated with RNAse of E/G family
MSSLVEIHYRRPPGRLQIFRQHLVWDAEDVKVTLARDMTFKQTMRIDGDVVLEDGSDVVWFTFPGLWHDIGRFHRADGTFTGIYANVIQPVEIDGPVWHTTDLYLDVWMGADGSLLLLDEDEFEEASGRELIDLPTATRVRQEADEILSAARGGTWPPAVVEEWTRERALEALDSED